MYFFARSAPKRTGQLVVGGNKARSRTKADKFGPIPVAKLVVHRVTPVPWSLILRRSSPLKAKPRPLRTFHVTTSNTGFIVQREVDPAVLLMCGQVEFWNKTGDNLIIQTLRILEGKFFKAFPKVNAPLTHDVVRGNLLGLGVVGSTSDDHIISVRIAVDEIQ